MPSFPQIAGRSVPPPDTPGLTVAAETRARRPKIISLVQRTRKGFGFHPLLGFVDHGGPTGGEPVCELLRPGKAGSNTAADHVAVFDAALAQLPAPCGLATRRAGGGAGSHRRRRSDEGVRRAPARAGVEFSVGATFGHLDMATALQPSEAGVDPGLPSPQAPCRRARRADRTPRRRLGRRGHRTGGHSRWPAGTRLILRKERPHPGAQLRITDADGLRVTGFLTNTALGGPDRQLADLELRHRRHARVEDRILLQGFQDPVA